MLALAILLPMQLAGGAVGVKGQHEVTRLNEVQSIYLQQCGGCHGIQGVSAPHEVPSLRGQVGNFLCTADGRAYLVRLPNVALAPLSDQKLAEVMNFVVFDLGGSPSSAADVSLYTAAEVAQLRKQPLTDTGLADYRARIVEELIERCGAPASLRTYSVTKMPVAKMQ